MKYFGYIIILLGLGMFGYSAYELYLKDRIFPSPQVEMPNPACQDKTDETLTASMTDEFMKGVIEPGSTFQVHKNWYKCRKIQREDIVYYQFSSAQNPVVRVVKGIPGDTFKLIQTEDKTGWHIEINGDMYEVNGKAYRFGSTATPVLSIYEKSNKGVLEADTILVFSTVPPGHSDSGMLGVVNLTDVIGKIDTTTIQSGTN